MTIRNKLELLNIDEVDAKDIEKTIYKEYIEDFNNVEQIASSHHLSKYYVRQTLLRLSAKVQICNENDYPIEKIYAIHKESLDSKRQKLVEAYIENKDIDELVKIFRKTKSKIENEIERSIGIMLGFIVDDKPMTKLEYQLKLNDISVKDLSRISYASHFGLSENFIEHIMIPRDKDYMVEVLTDQTLNFLANIFNVTSEYWNNCII